MSRTASKVPTTLIEMAKSRSTDDESPCVEDEELDEGLDKDASEEAVPDVALVADGELDKNKEAVPDIVLVADGELDKNKEAVPDVVLVLVLVSGCDVEEIIDEVLEESRTSKLRNIQSINCVSRKMTDNLHEHINNGIIATGRDGYKNRMFLICGPGPRCNHVRSYGCVSARCSRY
jgi:hypothetical protein